MTDKSTSEKKGIDMVFYCAVPGSGIDIAKGKKLIPQDFKISNDSLEASTTTTIPKFKFEG